jgi:tight adherence protein B
MLYQALAFFVGPSVMNALIMRSVMARFKRFDKDYPPFLLSLVGLLKTGMNPLQALGTAAKSLEGDSLVREEVELMLERLRLGVSEERSIGAFGDEVYHAEIELFVQALLLSRSVGGTLSDTLERLAKQVRRRQYFRMMAVAAIGLQRGSIWFIIAIQVSLMTFIYFILPSFIEESFAQPMGWQVWQFGVAVMILGMYWVRKVSNIRC